MAQLYIMSSKTNTASIIRARAHFACSNPLLREFKEELSQQSECQCHFRTVKRPIMKLMTLMKSCLDYCF
eukprot:4301678-Ditylum_brightwellii.AAC.1